MAAEPFFAKARSLSFERFLQKICDFLKNLLLIRHDEGYKFLRALRGSPPNFEKAKKDLFAIIRQLGPAT